MSPPNIAFHVSHKPCKVGKTGSHMNPRPCCERHGPSLNFTSQTALHSSLQRVFALQTTLLRKIENRSMLLTARNLRGTQKATF